MVQSVSNISMGGFAVDYLRESGLVNRAVNSMHVNTRWAPVAEKLFMPLLSSCRLNSFACFALQLKSSSVVAASALPYTSVT